ncbi:MAG: hypothetical protein Q9217_005747 [Psora testacea]
MTVPVPISARTGIFNIPVPQTNLEVTSFIQNNTQQGRNFSETVLTGYKTTAGTYNISTQFCFPTVQNHSNPTIQVLTHGIGFDKGYWDSAYNNFNYSYVDVATDQYKYCTLAYDRLGIGNSSHGEPLNEIQASLEVAALAQLTLMLRNGSFPGVNRTFQKVTHIGHSFGSIQIYSLVNLYPNISDGIVLTAFAMNSSFIGYFGAGAHFVQARENQPSRFGKITYAAPKYPVNMTGVAGMDEPSRQTGLNYPNGYLTHSDADANQYLYLFPGYFDPGVLPFSENSKQPVTLGELLTLESFGKALAGAQLHCQYITWPSIPSKVPKVPKVPNSMPIHEQTPLNSSQRCQQTRQWLRENLVHREVAGTQMKTMNTLHNANGGIARATMQDTLNLGSRRRPIRSISFSAYSMAQRATAGGPRLTVSIGEGLMIGNCGRI